MKKFRLGKTGMMVTRLGFGGIPIQRLSEEEAVDTVKKCLKLGINFIDTAAKYTNSEERIGKAVAEQSNKVILSSRSFSRTREGVESDLKRSLKRLRVESIDLYGFHNVSDFDTLKAVLEPNGPMAVLEEAKRAGQIQHIGITSHSIDVAKEAVKLGCFETVMFPFNFLCGETALELLAIAREYDVGFIAMKSLAGGMLKDASLAFKYLFQFPDVLPIPGTEKPEEMEQIIQVLEQSPATITKEEENETQRLREELGTRFCHRCEYCQPCSGGIFISSVILFNTRIGRQPHEVLVSGRFADEMEKVVDCIDCGLCEERCPYGLPIRKIIHENYELYQQEKRKPQ